MPDPHNKHEHEPDALAAQWDRWHDEGGPAFERQESSSSTAQRANHSNQIPSPTVAQDQPAI